MHWKVVSCIVWAEHARWSRVFHQNAHKGSEFLHKNRLPKLEELPPKHRRVPCLVRSQVKQPKRCPWGVMEKSQVLGHGLKEFHVCRRIAGRSSKSREKAVKERHTVFEGIFPYCAKITDRARWSEKDHGVRKLLLVFLCEQRPE